MKNLLKYMERERFFLYCALITGIVLLLLQVVFSVDMYRDSAAVYSPMARSLAAGEYREAFHPGIPCLNVLLSFPLTRLGLKPETALGIISSAFYVGTIPFICLLLRHFLPGILASIGSLFFACAPKIIRFSCSAIIDSGKIFFLTAALFFLLKFIEGRYKSPKTALLFGMMAGGLSLARSEGFGNVLVLFGCMGIYWCIDSIKERKALPLFPAIIAIFTWIALLFIRVEINRHFCGVFVFDLRISNGLARIFSSAPAAVVSQPVVRHLRVSWFDLLNKNIRGSYEPYLIFAAVGLLLFIFRLPKVWPGMQIPGFLKWNRFYWILLLVPFTNALIFKASDIASHRYFLLNIPCLLVFTLTGVFFIWQWITRFVPVFIPVIAAFILFIWQVQSGTANMFSAKAKKQYETGKMLGKMLASEHRKAKVLFGAASIEWYYSGLDRARAIESAPPAMKTFSDFDYALYYQDEKNVKFLVQRNDLREMPLPGAENIRLFKRIK